MSLLNAEHIGGILATLALVSAVGLYAGSKVKSAADFSTGGRSVSAPIVAGTIMGTLVGGASTIGTASWHFNTALPPGGLPWGPGWPAQYWESAWCGPCGKVKWKLYRNTW